MRCRRWAASPAEYSRLTAGVPQPRIRTQMFQFWPRIANQMTHRLVDWTTADHPVFRELSYRLLSRKDGAQWSDLGTYQA
jgi:hypothetical protein